nr:transcriptional activator hap5 [Quercus suber]
MTRPRPSAEMERFLANSSSSDRCPSPIPRVTAIYASAHTGCDDSHRAAAAFFSSRIFATSIDSGRGWNCPRPTPYGAVPPAQAAPVAPKRYDGKNGSPLYDTAHGGHYGASSAIATSGHQPPQETFTGHWQNVSQGLNGSYRDILNTYWQNQVSKLETEDHDYKLHQLPLARIKKVMKADPEVKMISAEAPILFAKGCDIFITELTMRAWIHAEENKRRTLQRSDIASALAKSDMFDFLIDIVPREDATPQHKRRPEYTPVGTYAVPDSSNPGPGSSGMVPGQDQQQQMGGQAEFGMEQPHLAQQPQYQQQTGMYPPPAAQQQFSGNQMFDPNMYAQPPQAYAMGQMQQMPQAQMYQSAPGQPQQQQQHPPMGGGQQYARSDAPGGGGGGGAGVDEQDAEGEQEYGANG